VDKPREMKVNNSYSSSLKTRLIKELLIWAICLIAASIGPGLLINAHYRVHFIIWPLILLVLCFGIYHLIVRKISVPALWFVGVLLFYGIFVYYVCQRFSTEYYVQNMISFKWDELTGGDGLFRVPTLHLLWLVIIVFALTFRKNKKRLWLPVVQSSFEYWAMIMVGFFFAVTETLTNSGEGKVILLNIFLLYGFLQQAIEIDLFKKSLKKHWVKIG
jgi:phosphatidylglycerophosphatase A